jgi:nucleotide-binding universal stress UspA family protein
MEVIVSILVATDFSPSSRTAVRLATALARRRGASLCLVHAIDPPPVIPPEMPAATSGAWEREILRAAELAIVRDAAEIREAGMRVETQVLLGSPSTVILAAARDQKADLVVVGTHGRKGAAHLFLGSVAESVVRSASCPVLVTRDQAPDVERWEGRDALRLVVATDGSAASQAALSWVGQFAPSQTCDLSLVRVYWPPEEALRYGLSDPWGGPERDPELLRLLERDLQRDARALIGQVPGRLRFRAASRGAAEAVAEDAAVLGVDAMVIGVSKHRSARWAALSSGAVLRHATLPVFCVPETTAPAHPHLTQVRSILLATDLSDASREVVFPAYGLLRPAGGRVELCTAHVLGPIDAIAGFPLEPPLGDERRAAIETQLRALIPPEAQAFGISTNVSVLEGGFAAETILSAAERLDVDLIALGSHGRSGFSRALLGSVAEEVTRHSPRPVLIVRSQRRATRA